MEINKHHKSIIQILSDMPKNMTPARRPYSQNVQNIDFYKMNSSKRKFTYFTKMSWFYHNGNTHY